MHLHPYRSLVARTISIVGHPAVVTPAAALLALHQHMSSSKLLAAGGNLVAVAAGLIIWGALQVKRRRWRHIDASDLSERRDLNAVTLGALVIGALIAAITNAALLSLGLASGSLILAMAIVSANKLKMSQHVAFATLSTFLAGFAGIGAAAAAFILVLAVAWSRVQLGRHSKVETLAGAGAGALAGLAIIIGSSAIV